MLIIFAFFSVISTSLVAAIAVAVVNVVIRRECAYLVEEKLNAMGENQRFYTQLIGADQVCAASQIDPVASSGAADVVWPGSYTSLFTFSRQRADNLRPSWLKEDSFTGNIVERGHLGIRSFKKIKADHCETTFLADTGLNAGTMRAMCRAAGLQMADGQPIELQPYREQEGLHGEIAANFIPGSRRAVPVVITVKNWQTGQLEDWVICTVRLSYGRTAADLSRMGLRLASWIAPLGGLALGSIAVYTCGLFLSARLSRQIVSAIDGLTHAARRVGKGDFSIKIVAPGQDQLSRLAKSFNDMTGDLHNLREQEKQAALLEWDVTLAREVQEHFFPQPATQFAGINVSGMNHPARIVSGDMHGIFHHSECEAGILCADLSGKGVSAALMMAHMQGLLHGRLLLPNQNNARPSPAAFVEALNRDLLGRFGDGRYATLFYGEYDSRTRVMRYVNAGHCRPIVISPARDVMTTSGGDPPVGLLPEITFQERQITLSSGCSMLIYTDGVTDAIDAKGEPFGESRLLAFCGSLCRGADAKEIITSIADRVFEWSTGVDRADDITVVALTVE